MRRLARAFHRLRVSGRPADHNEENLAYVGSGGLLRTRRDVKHNGAVAPGVWIADDTHGEPAFQAWCECGWRSEAFTTIEPAIVDCWRHEWKDAPRVSDLRRGRMPA